MHKYMRRACMALGVAALLALGAAKEAWMDGRFDRGDFAADAAGVLTWEIHF